MNYEILMSILKIIIPPIFALNAGIFLGNGISRELNGFILRKDYKNKNIRKLVLPPQLTQEVPNIDLENILSKKLGNEIVNFEKVLANNFSIENLKLFYNNLNDLKITERTFWLSNLFLHKKILAVYNETANEILINTNDYRESIFHELFHVASTKFVDGSSYSGFSQNSSIGDGINEGYTELLTERYFDVKCITYHYEVDIAKKVEMIVGKKVMENLYLNADLLGLIFELQKYSPIEKVIDFITNVDFLSKYGSNSKPMTSKKLLVTNTLNNVNSFLLRMYGQKLKEQLNNKEIDYNQFNKKLTSYIASLDSSSELIGFKYKFLVNKNLKEDLNGILKDLNDNEKGRTI